MLRTTLFVFLIATLCDAVQAQRLLLQAPLIGRFSISTSVSVPDRGGALLGSVSRAADGTKSFGPRPYPTGSSRGRSVSHRSISSHVYIHDFAAMDPFLRLPPPPQVDTAKDRIARISRAAKAYAKMADKFDKRGKPERAAWYRRKALEYERKAVASVPDGNGETPR